jgi:DNA repair exonuclease SbcCD ATPase subunit
MAKKDVDLSKPKDESKKHTEAIKKLENEKSALLEKTKNLAGIIEDISSKYQEAPPVEKVIEPKIKEINDKLESKLKEFGDSIDSIKKGIEKPEKSKELSSVLKEIKEKIDAKISSIEGQMKNFDKVSALEENIKSINERLDSRPEMKELTMFGENVESQTKIGEVKKSIENLSESLNELKGEIEPRIQNLENQIKDVEKLSVLEENIKFLNEKLGTEAVKKLKELIFSSDEIYNQIIPQEIRRHVSDRLIPILSDIKELKESLEEHDARASKILSSISDIKNNVKLLDKLEENIDDLHSENEGLNKKLKEQESEFFDRFADLKSDIKKNLDDFYDEIQELKKTQKEISKTIGDRVKENISEFSKSKVSEIEKSVDSKLVNIKTYLSNKQLDLENRIKQFNNIEKNLNQTIDNIQSKDKILADFVKKAKEIEGILKRTSVLEENIKLLNEKFGAENVKKIKELTYSADEICNQVIPREVKRNISDRIMPVLSEFKSMKEDMIEFDKKVSKFSTTINEAKMKIKSLEDTEEEMKEFITEKDKIHQKIKDQKSEVFEKLIESKSDLRELAERVSKKMEELKKTQKEIEAKITDKVVEKVSEFSKSKTSEIEKSVDKRFTDAKTYLSSKQLDLENRIKQLNDVQKNLDKTLESVQSYGKIMEEWDKRSKEINDVFQKISTIREAGNRLLEINKKIEKQKTEVEGIKEEVSGEILNKFDEKTKDVFQRISGVERGMERLEKVVLKEKEIREKEAEKRKKYLKSIMEDLKLKKNI